eukprot:gene20583-22609_t
MIGLTRRRNVHTSRKEDQHNSIGLKYNLEEGETTEIAVKDLTAYDSVMSCRDRTNEFFSAIRSLQSRQGKQIIGHDSENGFRKQRSHFTTLSKKIGLDINNTFVKLEKLALLAKRKSLFDDKSIEIQELTYIIKQDINQLNQQLAELHQIVNHNHSDKNKHVQTHSHSVVISLQSKLAHMSKDFKDVLEVRTENMKQQRQRRDQFSQGPLADSLPSAALAGHASGSVLQQQSESGSVAIEMDALENQRISGQMQIAGGQEEYIKSRADAMESIEQTIVELGGIFSKLAHMVKEQEEEIKRIDTNIEDTEANVELAHAEILKYFQSITSNRWLILKVFFVLIIFFIFFVVFIA